MTIVRMNMPAKRAARRGYELMGIMTGLIIAFIVFGSIMLAYRARHLDVAVDVKASLMHWLAESEQPENWR